MEKAEQNGIELSYEIIEFIATHIKSNIRDLEGTIIRILAKSSLMNRDVDFSLVAEVVKERTGNKLNLGLNSESIINQVSDVFGVTHQEMLTSPCMPSPLMIVTPKPLFLKASATCILSLSFGAKILTTISPMAIVFSM